MVKESIDNSLTNFHTTQCYFWNLGRSPLLRLMKSVSTAYVLGHAELHMQQQTEFLKNQSFDD